MVQCWSSWRPWRLWTAGCHSFLLPYPCMRNSKGNRSQNHWMDPSAWNWGDGPCRPDCGLLVPEWRARSPAQLLQLCSPFPMSKRFGHENFFSVCLCAVKKIYFFCLLNFFFHNLSKITFQSTSIFFFFPPAHNSINIQGTWGPWSDWSPCPALCGQVGVQLRHRNCQSDSLLCSGPKLDGKACNGPECPKTGEKKA